MKKKLLKFGEVEIDKQEFRSSKRAVGIYNVNTDKIFFYKFLHSIKCSTYFVGNKYNEKVSPLSVLLPEMSECFKKFHNP